MIRVAFATSLALSAAILAPFALPAMAATESVIYSFKFDKPGEPVGRLHFMSGSLFGTVTGQPSGFGQVFELTESAGTWTESPLIKFDDTDGAYPTAGLIQEAGGFLFGTTALGDAYAGGNVFELHQAGGSWTHETLWAFGGTSGDGKEPLCDLVVDGSGNLYGTTSSGGAHDNGAVYEITP